ncbi:hypothetical protein OUZ56_005351 [Daphnia magna]|uniref:Uncharacterized protein n=1 Tax=Daphnia magna TaxID=35525 RepID=A0ABQ9YSM9_9CRUS|nr:hypothetical protein OUZ56_005351 [Daphnia magna]
MALGFERAWTTLTKGRDSSTFPMPPMEIGRAAGAIWEPKILTHCLFLFYNFKFSCQSARSCDFS